MKTAIIHDWLVTYTGSERVLEQVLALFPEADVFSTVDFVPKDRRGFLRGKTVHTSFIQKLPFARRKYRRYIPLMPLAVESFDFSDYELVISISTAVAKGVITSPRQVHVCYLQSRNMRYAYEDRPLYLSKNPVLRIGEEILWGSLRNWDYIASQRPDLTIANSEFVRRWHSKRYGVESLVLYPPVDTELFNSFRSHSRNDEYACMSRLEPSKRVDLVVESFNQLGRKLVVIGEGTERKKLESLAKSNVRFIGHQSQMSVASLLSQSRAFVYAGEEAFGISLVEAQAAGSPVICYRGGAAPEILKEQTTGVLFDHQTPESIIEAVNRFELLQISAEDCVDNAARFSISRFRSEFSSTIENFASAVKVGAGQAAIAANSAGG